MELLVEAKLNAIKSRDAVTEEDDDVTLSLEEIHEKMKYHCDTLKEQLSMFIDDWDPKAVIAE